jgi:hypothetical protein
VWLIVILIMTIPMITKRRCVMPFSSYHAS